MTIDGTTPETVPEVIVEYARALTNVGLVLTFSKQEWLRRSAQRQFDIARKALLKAGYLPIDPRVAQAQEALRAAPRSVLQHDYVE